MNKKKFRNVLVVLGGSSGERKVSLESGRACIKALRKQGYKVFTFDPKKKNRLIEYMFGFFTFALFKQNLMQRRKMKITDPGKCNISKSKLAEMEKFFREKYIENGKLAGIQTQVESPSKGPITKPNDAEKDTGNKNNIIERLKTCNSYHKRFGYK